MTEQKSFDISVGSGIISIFQRKNFKLERVFSEFIDNSLQSYLDHRDVIKTLPGCEKCKVFITWNENVIKIEDNAFGMNEEEFGRSLKLKSINPNAKRKGQLGVYGMGLKYAAASLGECYSISTTAFGLATRFSASISIKELEENNPTTLEASLNDEPSETHGTQITIESLRTKKNAKKETDLRQKLGIIYNHYIDGGILSIVLNNVPITYQRLELRKGEQGQYYEPINDSFVFSNKTYHFTGWIGILKRGNQDMTGFSLVQANRCIQLGYKPEKLFGKGNSFQNSRVFGEIVFDEDNYILSFDKDTFVWNEDGAEEAFISALKANSAVSKILKAARQLRFSDDEKEKNKQVELALSGNDTIVKIKDPEAGAMPMNKPDSFESEPSSVALLSVLENRFQEAESTNHFSVKIGQGKTAELYLKKVEKQAKDPWISLTKMENEDGYLLEINDGNAFIKKNMDKKKVLAFPESFALVLVASMLKAQDSGLKLSDSLDLLNQINEYMGNQNG